MGRRRAGSGANTRPGRGVQATGEAVTAEASRGSGRGGSDSDAGAAASDAEAVERARNGDHAAFRVLVERYQGRVFGLALRVLRDEEQARDVVQDAFLKVYGSLDRFEGRSGFYTWLYRIAMNLCLDRKRRERGQRAVRDEDALAESPADPEAVGARHRSRARPPRAFSSRIE